MKKKAKINIFNKEPNKKLESPTNNHVNKSPCSITSKEKQKTKIPNQNNSEVSRGFHKPLKSCQYKFTDYKSEQEKVQEKETNITEIEELPHIDQLTHKICKSEQNQADKDELINSITHKIDKSFSSFKDSPQIQIPTFLEEALKKSEFVEQPHPPCFLEAVNLNNKDQEPLEINKTNIKRLKIQKIRKLRSSIQASITAGFVCLLSFSLINQAHMLNTIEKQANSIGIISNRVKNFILQSQKIEKQFEEVQQKENTKSKPKIVQKYNKPQKQTINPKPNHKKQKNIKVKQRFLKEALKKSQFVEQPHPPCGHLPLDKGRNKKEKVPCQENESWDLGVKQRFLKNKTAFSSSRKLESKVKRVKKVKEVKTTKLTEQKIRDKAFEYQFESKEEIEASPKEQKKEENHFAPIKPADSIAKNKYPILGKSDFQEFTQFNYKVIKPTSKIPNKLKQKLQYKKGKGHYNYEDIFGSNSLYKERKDPSVVIE